MSDEALKPCPFCGESAAHMDRSWLDRRYGEAEVFHVQCQECCACGPSRDAESEAAEAWAKVGRLCTSAEAAEAAGFQRAIDAALAIIDARHDKEADEGTEFSPYHAGMVDALSWASDEVGELATKAKTEGADR